MVSWQDKACQYVLVSFEDFEVLEPVADWLESNYSEGTQAPAGEAEAVSTGSDCGYIVRNGLICIAQYPQERRQGEETGL